MKIAPIVTQWPQLHEFYQNLAQELHAQGIGSLITGGIACVLYELSQMTKACDLIIPIERAAEVLQVLAQASFQGHPCHVTLKYGAPLHERWLAGGWSSHTYFGPLEEPLARMDFFGRPPRVRRLQAGDNPYYLSRDGVARMKKTRREKDWAFANLLGHQMLQRGDPEGLLHITDTRRLIHVARETKVSEQMVQERPLLKLALNGDPELERYLKAEKEFWMALDDLRLTAYEKAWTPYGAQLKQSRHLLSMGLLEQNQALVSIAEQMLDPVPLQTAGWGKIVAQAKEKTAQIFQNLNTDLLPSPQPFPDPKIPTNASEP